MPLPAAKDTRKQGGADFPVEGNVLRQMLSLSLSLSLSPLPT